MKNQKNNFGVRCETGIDIAGGRSQGSVQLTGMSVLVEHEAKKDN